MSLLGRVSNVLLVVFTACTALSEVAGGSAVVRMGSLQKLVGAAAGPTADLRPEYERGLS